MSRVRADLIKKALYDRHVQREHPDIFLTEVKTGPTHSPGPGGLHIMDALAVTPSWAHPCITGYEVKVSRSDFVGDEKWPTYLGYCHKFYFACPSHLIQPDELPVEVGLVWYNPETGALSTRRKAIYRLVEIPWSLLYYIIITRFDRERHPFFSSRRDYLEAYVADQAERKELGYRVGSKLANDVRALSDELSRLKQPLESTELRGRRADEYERVLRDLGVQVYWGWEERLKERLNSGTTPMVQEAVKSIIYAAERLKQMMPESGRCG